MEAIFSHPAPGGAVAVKAVGIFLIYFKGVT